MSDNVRELDANAVAKGHVVDCLRDFLRRAEAGDFRSVHIMAFRIDDGSMQRESAGGYNVFEVVAALECAKHGIIATNITKEL